MVPEYLFASGEIFIERRKEAREFLIEDAREMDTALFIVFFVPRAANNKEVPVAEIIVRE